MKVSLSPTMRHGLVIKIRSGFRDETPGVIIMGLRRFRREKQGSWTSE